VIECDRKASITRPWPTGAVAPWEEKNIFRMLTVFVFQSTDGTYVV